MSDLFEDPYKVAAKRGLEVILPQENELFLDIDSQEDEDFFNYINETLSHNGIEFNIEKKTTSAGGNTHIYIKIDMDPPITDMERLLLQACLGSDRKRELLGWIRIRFQAERPSSTFFEVPKPTTYNELEDFLP